MKRESSANYKLSAKQTSSIVAYAAVRRASLFLYKLLEHRSDRRRRRDSEEEAAMHYIVIIYIYIIDTRVQNAEKHE